MQNESKKKMQVLKLNFDRESLYAAMGMFYMTLTKNPVEIMMVKLLQISEGLYPSQLN